MSALSLVLLTMFLSPPAQVAQQRSRGASRPSVFVTLVRGGKPCAGTDVRADRPRAGTKPAAVCAPLEKTLKDVNGLVVSGIGIYAWNDNGATRVRVYRMVPAANAPNAWPDTIELMNTREARPLGDYTMVIGEEKAILEIKTLGGTPLLLRYEKATPAPGRR
jgi:hypothetical protein